MDEEKRQRRAHSIAAMGLVKREGDKFIVSTPSLRGKQTNYEVWRQSSKPYDIASRIVCNCLVFEENKSDPTFRCEHILAVKEALVTKNFQIAEPQELFIKSTVILGNDERGHYTEKVAQTLPCEPDAASLTEFLNTIYPNTFTEYQLSILEILEKDGKLKSFWTRGDIKKLL